MLIPSMRAVCVALLALAVTELALTSTPVDAQSPACRGIAIRKELRDLSASEKTRFLRVFLQMFQQVGGRPSIVDRLTLIHIKNQGTVHGYSNFLPWHRFFTRRLEMEMQKIDPSVALHYWDWTKEGSYPERGAILTDEWFGSTRSGCVRSRAIPNLHKLYPRDDCVRRDWLEGNSPGAFYGRLLIDQIRRQNTRFDDFRATFEGGPHASPHNGCGGDFGSMASPEDPLFWVHHSFVDKCWSDWQKDSPSRFGEYSGRNSNMSRALMTDPLVDLGAVVGAVIDHRRNLCYDFAATAVPKTVLWDRLPPPPSGGTTGPRDILVRAGVPSAQIPPSARPVPLGRRSYPAEDDNSDQDVDDYKEAPEEVEANDDSEPSDDSEPEPKPYMMQPITDEEAECIAKEYVNPIRHPAPIKEEFMKMNKICVETQRAREKVYCDMIDKVNAIIKARGGCDEEH